MTENDKPAAAEVVVSEEALKKAEEFIEEEEGKSHKFGGWLGASLTAIAVVMSLFHLYAAYSIVPAQVLRPMHVGFTLFLTFLLFPMLPRFRHRIMWWDVVAALLGVAVIAYMLYWGEEFGDRATDPLLWDQILGVALIVLILEAARRTSGWVMPFVVVLFIVYAMVGPHLPEPWTHRGYDISRLTGHMYMTLEGIFGVAVDVSSTLIILFTIYGAFLQFSGAGKFYIDFSFAAMGGKRSSAGRTVVLASFLLGGPSGSGVATTVTLGAVAYPMLAKAGYAKDPAGGLLAAGGLGAILSPPVLGAAAFLIAEFLKISYLDVILMATIPTILYYFGIFVMVEIDTHKFGTHGAPLEKHQRLWDLTRNFGFHFLSLVSIIFFMLLGYSPIMAVFWATVVAFVTSFLHRDCALLSYDLFRGREPVVRGFFQSKLIKALEGGSVGMLNVAATCAAAGIIVGVVTLTGLGLKFSSIVLDYADSGSRFLVDLFTFFGAANTPALLHQMKLLLTAICTSGIVWIVGLAVPVTASYIICAVIAAPALIMLGVPDFAAHMFIFYYAVLSEVSPPTALSPFAAAAITGGNPYKTTLQSWKYTMPAFLVPFMFVLDPSGQGLLLTGSFKTLAHANWGEIAVVSITAMIGIAALAGGMQNWLFKKTNLFERCTLILAGLLLVYPKPLFDYIGIALFALVIGMQKMRKTGDKPKIITE
ncbi:MAG: C4-dicarboxylate ABC transporter permease [Syntrophobacterales bacterium CG03_land_8_20_14_0_80_58_14]|nr:MAG: C4-dicarboxylate ABC transporter permease [Syntrophaceae bacterium CG2_30_58_14]PIV05015.1 MAG: C4-dicarboxylate ABC transporter permease [Syntrophobacterales bacterium CG03_land_8_20_14_0_80_58_14]